MAAVSTTEDEVMLDISSTVRQEQQLDSGTSNNHTHSETDKLEESLGSLGSLTEIISSSDPCDLKSLENITDIHMAENFAPIDNAAEQSAEASKEDDRPIENDMNELSLANHHHIEENGMVHSPEIELPLIITSASPKNVQTVLLTSTTSTATIATTDRLNVSTIVAILNPCNEFESMTNSQCHIDSDEYSRRGQCDDDEDTDGGNFMGFNGVTDSSFMNLSTIRTLPSSHVLSGVLLEPPLSPEEHQHNVSSADKSNNYHALPSSPPYDHASLKIESSLEYIADNDEIFPDYDSCKSIDAMETVSNLRSILDDLARAPTMESHQKLHTELDLVKTQLEPELTPSSRLQSESPVTTRQTRQKARQICSKTEEMELLSKWPQIKPVFLQLKRISLSDVSNQTGIVIHNLDTIPGSNVFGQNKMKSNRSDETDASFFGKYEKAPDATVKNICAPNNVDTKIVNATIDVKSKLENSSYAPSDPTKNELKAKHENGTDKRTLKDVFDVNEMRLVVEKSEQLGTGSKRNHKIESVPMLIVDKRTFDEQQAECVTNVIETQVSNGDDPESTKCVVKTTVDIEEEIASNVIQTRENAIDEEATMAQVADDSEAGPKIEVNTKATKKLRPISKQYSSTVAKHRKYTTSVDLYCHICNSQFWRTNHFRKHLNSHSIREVLSCHSCERQFCRVIELNNHMLDEHSTINTICQRCHYNFHNPLHLIRHFKSIHLYPHYKTHRCNVCTAAYTCRPDLVNHMANHFSRAFICCTCNESFPTQHLIKEHLTIHSIDELILPLDDRTYQCYLCHRRMNSYRALHDHMRLHSGLSSEPKSKRCKVCQRQFRKDSTLEKHMVLHTLLANDLSYNMHGSFICSNGDADFHGNGIEDRTRRHIRMAGEQYKCDSCNDSFETDAERRRHILSHSNDITHECDVCQKIYHRKENLYKHQQSKHGYKFLTTESISFSPPAINAETDNE